MSVSNLFVTKAYGQNQPLIVVNPALIPARRAPTANDFAPLGSQWNWKAQSRTWFLASVINNVATWLELVGSSGGGTFASLTVTPGPINLTGTTNINTAGNAVTSIGNAAAGVVNIVSPIVDIDSSIGGTITIGNALVAGTLTIGGSAQTGILAIAPSTAVQTVNIATANTGVKTINIGTGTVANVVTIGSFTGAAETVIQGGSAGVELFTPFVSLSGAVYIYQGAGAPSNGLALHVGDMYINTTAASAVTRLYIATGVGAWTNVTCAA